MVNYRKNILGIFGKNNFVMKKKKKKVEKVSEFGI